jgi:integrase
MEVLPLINIKKEMLNKSTQVLSISPAMIAVKQIDYATRDVGWISLDDIKQVIKTLPERDRLLLRFLFDSCLRISEALSVTPAMLKYTDGGWQVSIMGKGGFPRTVALTKDTMIFL